VGINIARGVNKSDSDAAPVERAPNSGADFNFNGPTCEFQYSTSEWADQDGNPCSP
jgi:hypothetical protein